MFAAFKERRPWAAAAVTFVIDPVFGMLYLNRWYYSLLYLLLEYFAFGAVAYFIGLNALLTRAGVWYFTVAYRAVGSFHAYAIARNRPVEETIHWYARWYSVIGILALCFVGRWALAEFAYLPFNVVSGSMAPTLRIGDGFLSSKLAYNASSPRRGDVVAFHVPHKWENIFVKRIIGLPGDRIQFINRVIYINGAPTKLQSQGFSQDSCIDSGSCSRFHSYEEALPSGGSHLVQFVDGETYAENTPEVTVPPGDYFVAGDNRDNSMDTRVEGFGFVPRNALVSRAMIKFFDGKSRHWVWQAID